MWHCPWLCEFSAGFFWAVGGFKQRTKRLKTLVKSSLTNGLHMLDMIDMCMEEISIVDHILPKICGLSISNYQSAVENFLSSDSSGTSEGAACAAGSPPFWRSIPVPNDRNTQLVDFESIYIAPLVVLHLYSKGSSEDQSGAFWMFLSQVSGCFLMFPSTKMFPWPISQEARNLATFGGNLRFWSS